ncbi:hypothetical protein [Streptomyces sirii]|uniref:hypothetical protein n=1 Tax=Streptomyces sirii TaxID=3127701 RepID=UPI003D36CF51
MQGELAAQVEGRLALAAAREPHAWVQVRAVISEAGRHRDGSPEVDSVRYSRC